METLAANGSLHFIAVGANTGEIKTRGVPTITGIATITGPQRHSQPHTVAGCCNFNGGVTVAHMLDFKPLVPNTNRATAVARRERGPVGRDGMRSIKKVDRHIEALIPRMTRYARVLTRDIVAAAISSLDRLARALGKSTSGSREPIFGHGYSRSCAINTSASLAGPLHPSFTEFYPA
jgi:hypothetical protein